MSYDEKWRQVNAYLTQGYAVLLNVQIPPRVEDSVPTTIMNMLLMDVEHLGKVVAGPQITGMYLAARLEPNFGVTRERIRKMPQSVYVYRSDF